MPAKTEPNRARITNALVESIISLIFRGIFVSGMFAKSATIAVNASVCVAGILSSQSSFCSHSFWTNNLADTNTGEKNPQGSDTTDRFVLDAPLVSCGPTQLIESF